MLERIYIFVLGLTSCFVASDIVRPCQLTDLQCIRRILSLNSNCNPNVVGQMPRRYTVNNYRFEAPYFNATYFDTSLTISNSNNCRVSEFFVNRSTNIVVLAVDCPRMNFASDRVLIQHESLKEDKIYNYYFEGNYPLIRLTTNIRYNNGLNLCNSFTFADVAVLPTYRLEPNDAVTRSHISPLTVFERECFFWRAPLLARFFINSLLCNFGCNF